MKLTIITENKQVGIDSYFYEDLNLSTANIPTNIWALQWNNSEGHIEYTNGQLNEIIYELPEWANECVRLWNVHHQNVLDILNAPNTAEENQAKATELLFKTDWVENPSVTDTNNTPHLTNKSDFDTYRLQLRAIAVYGEGGDIDFPTKPTAIWN